MSDRPGYKELRRLYDNLLRKHERVGLELQNQQKQHEDQEELEESNKDGEELANLVRTRSEAIKVLHTKLGQAKKTIADLKAEVETMRSNNEPQQQQQSGCVSTHSLAAIHDRYQNVLPTISENGCSMANAFRLTGCPRSTLRDFVAVAELKLVDSVKELEVVCRKRLPRHLPVMANMRREGKLLPLKFKERFYK